MSVILLWLEFWTAFWVQMSRPSPRAVRSHRQAQAEVTDLAQWRQDHHRKA